MPGLILSSAWDAKPSPKFSQKKSQKKAEKHELIKKKLGKQANYKSLQFSMVIISLVEGKFSD